MNATEHLAEAERIGKEIKGTKPEVISANPDVLIAAALQGILHVQIADLQWRMDQRPLGSDIAPDGAPFGAPRLFGSGFINVVPPPEEGS